MLLRAVPIHADGPTQVREPFHRDGWVYEEKVDGWRMLAYKDGGRGSSTTFDRGGR
jgi:ATP-dependent DNA ligase